MKPSRTSPGASSPSSSEAGCALEQPLSSCSRCVAVPWLQTTAKAHLERGGKAEKQTWALLECGLGAVAKVRSIALGEREASQGTISPASCCQFLLLTSPGSACSGARTGRRWGCRDTGKEAGERGSPLELQSVSRAQDTMSQEAIHFRPEVGVKNFVHYLWAFTKT